jgi:hypothetical protein
MPSPDKSIYPEGKDCSKCVHCYAIALGKCKCSIRGAIEPDEPLTYPPTWGEDAQDCPSYTVRPEFEEVARMVEVYIIFTRNDKGHDTVADVRLDSLSAGKSLDALTTDANGNVIAEGHIEVKEVEASLMPLRIVLGAKSGADMDVLGVYCTKEGADRAARKALDDRLRVKVEEWGVLE